MARVWDQVGVAPGEIPVVGWGNSVETAQESSTATSGRHVAGPQMTSYLGLSPGRGRGCRCIPPGFDIIVGALYEADTAPVYLDILSQ